MRRAPVPGGRTRSGDLQGWPEFRDRGMRSWRQRRIRGRDRHRMKHPCDFGRKPGDVMFMPGEERLDGVRLAHDAQQLWSAINLPLEPAQLDECRIQLGADGNFVCWSFEIVAK